MARKVSFTPAEVEQHIKDMLAGGVWPTVEELRRRLGRGSPALISKALHEWAATHGPTLIGRIPMRSPPSIAAFTASLDCAVQDARQAIRELGEIQASDLQSNQDTLRIQAQKIQLEGAALAIQRQSMAEENKRLRYQAHLATTDANVVRARASEALRDRDTIKAKAEHIIRDYKALTATHANVVTQLAIEQRKVSSLAADLAALRTKLQAQPTLEAIHKEMQAGFRQIEAMMTSKANQQVK